MAELLEEERAHIRLIEEYRNEVRQELRDRDSKGAFWFEKLGVPLLLVVVTALASGLVVPYILRKGEDRRQAVELKSRLIGDLVGDSATIQASLVRYNEELCDYWSNLTRFANNRRAANAMPRGEERTQRLANINKALEKEYDLRVAADQHVANARMTFTVALDRTRYLTLLYYGPVPELTAYYEAAAAARKAADELLDTAHQNELATIQRNASVKFRTCKNDEECNAIFAAAEGEVEKIRAAEPAFEKWRDATQKLTTYLLEHEPRLTSE